MKAFEFHQPGSLAEASKLLKKLGDGAMVYAGGTDIIPRIKLKKLAPAHLVSIKKIPGLRGIKLNKTSITIGALTRFNDIIFSKDINKHLPILAEVARGMASHQVRNLATIGGNICNAAPSADSAPILIALGAKVRIYSPKGNREVPLEKFFRCACQVELARGEILTHIIVPLPAKGTGLAYRKHEIRRTLEIAITGVAVALEMKDGLCKAARVVVGACAPTPLRCKGAEGLLIGTKLGPEDVEKAARSAAEEIVPISDVRASAEYRREMTAVNLKRAVEDAKGRAGA